jgi:predicted SAM-dependent methyltransferase
VDIIYSSHMLEHIRRDQAAFILRECHRVIKPDGIVRLVVPDLEVLVRAYLDRDRAILHSKLPTVGDAFIEGLGFTEATDNPAPFITRVMRRAMGMDGGHRWLYDAESLLHLLREAGFQSARRVPFGEGASAEAASMDTRSAFHLHVEAAKTAGRISTSTDPKDRAGRA